jgi:zinc protease
VAEEILSTGKSSRLYKRLVDGDQAVTTVKTSYNSHIDPSLFSIQAELKPGFGLAQLEQAIFEEIDRLKTEPVTPAELARAMRQIEADLVLTTEEPLQQAILLGQYETVASSERLPEDSRGYDHLSTLLDHMRAVKAEDVARVVREYLVEDNRTIGHLVNTVTVGGSLEISSGGPPARARFNSSRVKLAGSMPAGPEMAAFRSLSAQLFPARDRKGGHAGSVRTQGRRVPPQGGAVAHAARVKLAVERVELPNGLILLLSENHTTPSVSINAVVQAGSRYESDERAGLASLTGELLDEGTRTQNLCSDCRISGERWCKTSNLRRL